MRKAFLAFRDTFFKRELDLRVKTFNVLAMGGFLISVFVVIQNAALEMVFYAALCVLAYYRPDIVVPMASERRGARAVLFAVQ